MNTGNRFIDITGQRFGRLKVISPAFSKKRTWHWHCICDCGKVLTVSGCNLRNGLTRSCGCLVSENARIASRTHGGCYTSLYHVWEKIKARCNNPNEKRYRDYGGRGIKVCEEWRAFVPFRDWAMLNGYEKGLTIDRIDNNGDYTPENCRWVTNVENQKNKRNTVYVEYLGEVKCLLDWAEKLNIPYKVLYSRLAHLSWSEQRALKTPYTPRKKT